MTNQEQAQFTSDQRQWVKEYLTMTNSLTNGTEYRRWLGRVTVQGFDKALMVAEAWLSGYRLGFASCAAGLGQD